MSYLPNIETEHIDMQTYMQKFGAYAAEIIIRNELNEPKCTCLELSKQRALCPVCDKEEYDRMRGFSESVKKTVYK